MLSRAKNAELKAKLQEVGLMPVTHAQETCTRDLFGKLAQQLA